MHIPHRWINTYRPHMGYIRNKTCKEKIHIHYAYPSHIISHELVGFHPIDTPQTATGFLW